MNMKHSLHYLALAALIAAACSQAEIKAPEGILEQRDTLDMTVTGNAAVAWKEGDAISLFSSADTTNRKFIAESADGSSATFAGKGVQGNVLCGVYPYNEDNAMYLDGRMAILTSAVPPLQTADTPSCVFVAVSEDGHLVFNPAGAVARLVISGESEEEISAVSVASASGENLSGPARIMAFNGGEPVMLASAFKEGNSATRKGSWNIGAEPVEIDVYVIPASLTDGYIVSVTKADGVRSEKLFNEPVCFRSGAVTTLSEYTVAGGAKYYFTYTAASKLDLEGYKHEFNEGIGKIYLMTPEIPESLLPFNTDITGITIPADIQKIGNNAFDNCSALSSIIFEEGSVLTSIGDQAFRKTAVKSVNFPKSLKTLGVQSFNNAASLVTVNFPEDSELETISQGAFNGATSLKNVVIPASLKSLDKAFNTKFTTKLVITFKGSTPATLAAATGIFNIKFLDSIYVPAASVDAYKAAWATYAKFIKAAE